MKMDVVDVNDVMIRSRKDIKRAKVRVINKLVRSIRTLKNKKSNDEQKAANLKKADVYLQEIDIIKDLKVDSIFKFLLVTQLTINSLPVETDIKEKCMVRIGSVPFIKSRIDELRDNMAEFNKLRSIDGVGLPSSLNIAAKIQMPNVARKSKRNSQLKTSDSTKLKASEKKLTPVSKVAEAPINLEPIPDESSPVKTVKSSKLKPDEYTSNLNENTKYHKKSHEPKDILIDTNLCKTKSEEDTETTNSISDCTANITYKNFTPNNDIQAAESSAMDIQQRLLGISSHGNKRDTNIGTDDFFMNESDSYYSEESEAEEYILEERDDGMQVVLPSYYAKLKKQEDKQQPEPRKSTPCTKSSTDDVSKLFVNLGEGYASSEDDAEENESATKDDVDDDSLFFDKKISQNKGKADIRRKKAVNISASSSIFVQSLSTTDGIDQMKGKKRNRASQRKRQKLHLINSGQTESKPRKKFKKDSRKKEPAVGMHPSWEASIKRKQQESKTLPKFTGKKICFDDSD